VLAGTPSSEGSRSHRTRSEADAQDSTPVAKIGKITENEDTQSMTPSKCLAYLEVHGGRLQQVGGKTQWPDGSVTDFVWQYGADSIGVTGAKTAKAAIEQHMETWTRVKSRRENCK